MPKKTLICENKYVDVSDQTAIFTIKELRSLESFFEWSIMYSKKDSRSRALKKLLKKTPKNVLSFESTHFLLFWALSWALFWVLSGESTFLSTFLSTQKSTLGISAPTSIFTKAQLIYTHIRPYVPIAWKDATYKSLEGFAEPPITLQPPGAQAWKIYKWTKFIKKWHLMPFSDQTILTCQESAPPTRYPTTE